VNGTRLLAVIVLVVTAGCSVAGGVVPGKRAGRPVVVIVLDELPVSSLMTPNGRIDPVLFPNFRRLQQDSTWFRNATSPGTFTHDVMPAILTGGHPGEKLQGASFLPHNLFLALSDTHDILTTQPFPRMCPQSICKPMPRAPGDEPLRDTYPAFTSGDRGEKFVSLVSALEKRERPTLFFAHFVMPHQPWAYLPDGRRYLSAETLPGQIETEGRGKGWSDAWWLTAQAYQRHLLQLRFTDSLIGTVIDRLKREHMYDRTLLLVMADHGIAFERGLPKRIPTGRTLGELAAVPFFVKEPGQNRGRISDKPVELTDTVPTIADVLGFRYRWSELAGTSVFRKVVAPRVRTTLGWPLFPDGREKYRTIAKKHAMFGRRRGSLDLFRLGPRWAQDLIGKHVNELSIDVVSVEADIAYAPQYARANATSPVLPSLLQGTASGLAAGEPLIVAIDKRVAAVSPAHVEDWVGHFYCMVPPRLLATRPNRVEVFRILP